MTTELDIARAHRRRMIRAAHAIRSPDGVAIRPVRVVTTPAANGFDTVRVNYTNGETREWTMLCPDTARR